MSHTPLTEEHSISWDDNGDEIVLASFARELERDVRESLFVIEKVLTYYPPRAIDVANASVFLHGMRQKHPPREAL
jgi:hypothetical protein